MDVQQTKEIEIGKEIKPLCRNSAFIDCTGLKSDLQKQMIKQR